MSKPRHWTQRPPDLFGKRCKLLRDLVEAGFRTKVSPTYGTVVYSPEPGSVILGHVTDSGAWRPVRIPLDFAPLTAVLDRNGVRP